MELQVGGHLAATAVTPIDFDTTNQVQSLIDQLEASINSHIQSASQSVDEKEASQLRQLLHEVNFLPRNSRYEIVMLLWN